MIAAQTTALLDRLPSVRGRLTADAPLAHLTWFRVGGPADVLFRPVDLDDLQAFLNGCPKDIPLTVVGVASNLLIRDGGIRGVVIRLGRGFTEISTDGAGVTAGAAALDLSVAQTAARDGIAGLEFLSGIPGTIGGALRMNAGAYGREVKDVLVRAHAVDRNGQVHAVEAGALGLSYRHCAAPADWIFVGADMIGTPGSPAAIAEDIADIQAKRAETQPIKTRTGGSTFANPEGDKAWRLIDAVGARGLRVGGAQISEKHCNFLLNTGEATAADIEALGEEARRRVMDSFGVDLRWEIRRIGDPLSGGAS